MGSKSAPRTELAGFSNRKTLLSGQITSPLLKTHQNRKVKCFTAASCTQGSESLEACEYHPGVFSVMCRNCPYRGKKPHSVKCIAHYKRRWSCCDSTSESEFGIGGAPNDGTLHAQKIGYKHLLEDETARDDKITSELRVAMSEHDKALRKNRKLGMDNEWCHQIFGKGT